MLKKGTVLLLAALLLLLAAGCGQGKEAPAGATGTPAGAPTPAPTPTPAIYSWGGATLAFQEMTDEADPGPGISAPSGKYVLVVLAVEEGKLDFTSVESEYEQRFALDCGGETYAPVAMESKGVEIDGDKAYGVGTVNFYFDVPADTDVSGAAFIMAQ